MASNSVAKVPQIKELKSFLESKLNGIFIQNDIKVSFLTQPGDNFGSTIVKISIDVTSANDAAGNQNNATRMELVGKMPSINEMFRKIFQVPITFAKETAAYEIIIPTLINFQRSTGINDPQLSLDIFCPYLGSRTSLKPGTLDAPFGHSKHSNVSLTESDAIDENALIIFENLKCKGFSVADRLLGFEVYDIKTILRNLANYHAVPIALRFINPELFDKDLRPYLNKVDMDTGMTDEAKDNFLNRLFPHIELCGWTGSNAERIRTAFHKCMAYQMVTTPVLVNQFTTMAHNDFWVNNIMLKQNDNAKDNSNNFVKIIDFQLFSFESCVKDVLFFLMTSISANELDNKFDTYLKYYHECLHRHLNEFHIRNASFPIDQFSFEHFHAEVNRFAPLEFYHVIMMLSIVFSNKGAIEDIEKLDMEFFSRSSVIGDPYFGRLGLILQMYDDRRWF